MTAPGVVSSNGMVGTPSNQHSLASAAELPAHLPGRRQGTCWLEKLEPRPGQAQALSSRDPAVFVQPCRLTISLIQIGANGDVRPLEQG
jgi:hypothetical protein